MESGNASKKQVSSQSVPQLAHASPTLPPTALHTVPLDFWT
jgi:hypothetical protein